jgi:hypothetical protein
VCAILDVTYHQVDGITYYLYVNDGDFKSRCKLRPGENELPISDFIIDDINSGKAQVSLVVGGRFSGARNVVAIIKNSELTIVE